MSIAVDFYAGFTKRLNSTKRPTASPTSINCTLKDSTSIVEPVLEIRGSGASFNPRLYVYCYISSFGRYYYINDWSYENAVWLCYCKVDVLGSFKIPIGLTTKYILRSSYASNLNIVDTLYPSLAWQPNYYYDSVDFQFARSFAQGSYVLGVANTDSLFGALSYYVLSSANITALVKQMLPQTSELWSSGFTGMTDSLYRSIYSPFDYIKSCKWFPISAIGGGGNSVGIKFGNYEIPNASSLGAVGVPLQQTVTSWESNYRELSLPTSWLSLEAKYRVPQYAHIYIVFNPWGIIELNPLDFTDTNKMRLYIYPDCISGDCMLKIYKWVGNAGYLITEKNVNLGVDINLSSASFNASSLFSSAIGTAGGIASGILTGGAAGVVQGAIAASGGLVDAMNGSIPSASGSVGQTFGGARAMEGTATLFYTSTYFASEDNADFGKPLCESRQISLIPGYVQCQDGHIEIETAYRQEIEEVENYLTGGFFYE